MQSLPAPRPNRCADPVASLATPSTNGLSSLPNNANTSFPVYPLCAAAALHPLSGADPQPLRHQVWELPEIKPYVTEYQRHRLTCRCGTVTCGALTAGVSTGQAGPHLIAFSGLNTRKFERGEFLPFVK
jgi:hypothetical protein